MKLHENVIKYELVDGLPGLEGIGFTEESERVLEQKEAVEFAAQKGSGIVLQSLREAAAFHLAKKEGFLRGEQECTRTATLFFKENGKWYCAVGDSPNPEKNLVMAHPIAYSTEGAPLFYLNNPLVEEHRKHAERSERIFEVPEQLPFKLSTEHANGRHNGKSPFNQHKAVHSFFGRKLAELIGMRMDEVGSAERRYLEPQGKRPAEETQNWYLWMPTPESLERHFYKGSAIVAPALLASEKNCPGRCVYKSREPRFQFSIEIGMTFPEGLEGIARGVRGAKEWSK